MQAVDLDRQFSGAVTIDLCGQCKALWFDAFESVQLSPAGTLQLFRAIHDTAATAPVPLPEHMSCPRCDTPLDLTHDLQHATRFTYYRCRHGHGRFTPFVQFLREKNFIRPVSPADLDKLKKLVRIIRCSSCGAPVDLQTQTACGYCRAPIAILDPDAVARTLRELDGGGGRRGDNSPGCRRESILENALFERGNGTSRRATIAQRRRPTLPSAWECSPRWRLIKVPGSARNCVKAATRGAFLDGWRSPFADTRAKSRCDREAAARSPDRRRFLRA